LADDLSDNHFGKVIFTDNAIFENSYNSFEGSGGMIHIEGTVAILTDNSVLNNGLYEHG
jgi:hypothetical protein